MEILVVDDDALITLMVSESLKLQGFGVAIAEDGAAALTAVRQRRPALILLDAEMPVLDGFAVLKALVSHPREPLSRDKLMNLARGREYSAMERSIDVQISRLRRMVEEDPAHPRYIQTVWGLGYVFVPDGSKA